MKEKEFKPKYTYEDKVCYEANKITADKLTIVENTQKFMEGAIARQNKAFNKDWAKTQLYFACDVLKEVKMCPPGSCQDCPIYVAHDKAMDEINNGTRKPEETNKYQKATREPDYILHVYENKKTGRLTLITKKRPDK